MVRCIILGLLSLAALAGASRALASDAAAEAGQYEGRAIQGVEVVFDGTPPEPAAAAEFAALLNLGAVYSTVRIHDALRTLFETGRIASGRVEAVDTGSVAAGAGRRGVRLRFILKRQVLVGDVVLALNPPTGSGITVDELRSRLSITGPNARASEQNLRRSADEIQSYLRDRGFFRSEVNYSQQPTGANGTRARVTFQITLNQQATVAAFNSKISGFDVSSVQSQLKLHPGAPFSRDAMGSDLNVIRGAIIAKGFRAPQLDDPQVQFDSASNTVTVNLTGTIGPKVNVTVQNITLSEKKAKQLLPVETEGNIDESTIVEGARRLRNNLQEDGYFFASVSAVCTVTPPVARPPAAAVADEAEGCQNLNPADLVNHTLEIKYVAEPGRRLKLTQINIEGTDKLSYADVKGQLKTKEANALAFIPRLGYGRGYTSKDLLDQDARTIQQRMQDLGYRQARVEVRQGISLANDGLVITFAVTEGRLTRIAGVEVRGNQVFTDAQVRGALQDAGKSRCDNRTDISTPCYKTAVGAPFSRSQARQDGDAIRGLYARSGYIEALVDFSFTDLPPKGTENQVRVIYTLRREGEKTYINQIYVNGLVRTNRDAVIETITLHEGDLLRADKIAESERLLYATDAFRQVIITTEPAGETASGYKRSDVIIDVEELKPRDRTIGGGYSTDTGPLGLFDIRNVNLFGKLQQGAVRTRFSTLQQTVRIEYDNPRFRRYGAHQYAPLALSIQYQRDSTVTRFFRTTIDQGNQGIVQSLDAKGNPIDINCSLSENIAGRCPTVGQPTINRLTLNAETQRVIDQKSRETLFLRYSYEDVRIFNIRSLLIQSILQPDRAVRLSRFGATFVRDTRDNQFDSTRGEFLSVDYGLSLRQLGGNISFNKLEATYRRFYRLDQFRRTVLAGNVTIGLANLFNPIDRNGNGVIDDVDLTLPISERFFAGGSTTLRGFGYQEAGPRVAVAGGTFRNSKGDLVTVNPFLVPVGGNAELIVNLEARIPLTSNLQFVPFYDGGNIYRHVSDIFRRQPSPGEDPNLFARFTHTIGAGFRIKTPIGGSIAIDYGFLTNPPSFVLPQQTGTAIIRPKNSQIQFRFTQAF